MGNIERDEQGANRPDDSQHPWHDSRIRELEGHVALLVGERNDARQQLRGAVEALQAAYELVTVDEARSSASIVTQLREDLHDALGRLRGPQGGRAEPVQAAQAEDLT